VDWQKQSNQYGANAEQMASQGMMGTGYSESSQVAMYNQYQNRVATTREAIANATLQYNNAIKEAQIQNNSIMAEIAAEAYKKQLELALQAFQHKNSLIMNLSDKKMQTEQMYYQRAQDVLAQINQENALKAEMEYKNAALAEEQRQFNETMAFQKEQANKTYNFGNDDNDGYEFDDSHAVSTDYYNGDLNPDANKYGTFENGYQPKGIKNFGKVSKTGDHLTFSTQTLSGETREVRQNIWSTGTGKHKRYWYWDGRLNRYVPYQYPGTNKLSFGVGQHGSSSSGVKSVGSTATAVNK
jgi:hypothetical protein